MMNSKARAALGIATAMVCGASLACDPKLPRCQKVNELLDRMNYKEQIASIQMECRGRAASMSPENLATKRPAMLMGIEKNTPSWDQVRKAYDEFIEEACGSDELLYLLLSGYRYAWDVKVPGAQLDSTLEALRAKGPDGIKDDAVFVSQRVNRVMMPILVRMSALAEKNYQARIKAVISGEALEIANGDLCEPPNDLLTPISEKVVEPTRLRTGAKR